MLEPLTNIKSWQNAAARDANVRSDVLATASVALAEWSEANRVDRSELERIGLLLSDMASGKPRWAHPDQRPGVYMRGLRTEPWWDATEFEWTASLAHCGEKIVQECDRNRDAATLRDHPDAPLVLRGAWNILPLFTFGKRHAENCDLLPNTVGFVESVPTATTASLVYLSSLAPRTTIAPHCGPTNCRLRCHVGITIPPDCWIRVGSEARSWEPGRCMVFDDSFEHEVRNDNDVRRDVLIVDFWHPDLSDAECRALQFLTSIFTAHGLIQDR